MGDNGTRDSEQIEPAVNGDHLGLTVRALA